MALSDGPVQALVIGLGGVATSVIGQLKKNRRFHITWAGKEFEHLESIIEEGEEEQNVIRTIKLEKIMSPLSLNELIEDIQPDIVFLCQRGVEWDAEDMVASSNMERAMLGESIIIGDAPIISVSLEQEIQYD